MRRYMKSALPYRGVQTPGVRALTRELVDSYPLATSDAWRETILTLWQAAFREERYAALELLGHRRYRAFRTIDALPLYEELIVSGAWWDLVDPIATRRLRELLESEPRATRPVLRAWSRDANLWKRRSAIIAQVGLRERTDEELLFACIEPSRREREFFLRKAIGWALREYGKAAPEPVRRYVETHELSPLSRREALKYAQSN
jgi:3-methyladenine DNA glycosylase AlkD